MEALQQLRKTTLDETAELFSTFLLEDLDNENKAEKVSSARAFNIVDLS